jgi:hypothetical protein
MANVVVVLVVALVAWYIVARIRRSHGLVARRGLSIGADLGMLGDAPRVRVASVGRAGSQLVRVVLTPETGAADLDLLVSLTDDDFGLDLLRQWQDSQEALGIVMPPDSHIVRLRSVADLQPLTLRRVDD